MNDRRRKRGKVSRSAHDIAQDDARGLGGLLARAQQLDQLDRAVAAHLGPKLAPHVRVANVRQGTLILMTPVAPIATRLRMEASTLLARLKASYPDTFNGLEVRVTPDLPDRI
ncbi:MAG: DUF721 domain-containing protein [Pseudomonadota bacterium]